MDGLDNIEELIREATNEYVGHYKSSNIIPNSMDIEIETMVSDIDREYSIFAFLNRKGVNFHDLPLQVQRRLPIYLTKELEVQIGSIDHYWYWAWSAEVFQHFYVRKKLDIVPQSVGEKFFTLFHGVLMKLTYPPITRELDMLNRVIQTIVDHHVQEFLRNKSFVVASVSFLILEAVVRELCVKYGAPREEVENKSLLPLVQKLLRLFKEDVDSSIPDEFKHNLQEFMDLVESIWAPKIIEVLKTCPEELEKFEKKKEQQLEGWRVLSYWRNNLYHGKKTWLPRVYGVVLNLICLIVWHNIPEEEYVSELNSILQHVEWQLNIAKMGGESMLFNHFYPPKL